MSQACFACTTPYQVMGAVGIVSAGKMKADLILFGMFEGYEALASRIRETGLFAAVAAVPPDKYKSPGRLGAFGQMARAGEIAREILPGDGKYEVFYSSSRAHIKNVLLHDLIRKNPELKIVVYDDGMGTYDGQSHVLNTTSLRAKAEKLMGWDLYGPERISFLVYEPALFTIPERYRGRPVAQMPKPGDSPETMDLLRQVFPVREEDQIREKVIIFDPLRGLEKEREKKFPVIDACYREVVEAFGQENVVIKPHPRSTEKPEAEAKIYAGTGIPMEILYAGMEDLEERVLVTYASTAVYTPKMMFGKEPRVIALFRIADGETGSEWEPQFTKFRTMYTDRERMAAPVNQEGLRALLDRPE